MKLITAAVLSVLVAPITQALAQDSTSTLPESMRIQQGVTQQNSNEQTTPSSSGESRTTTEAPGSAGGPVEMNRIDPAAPSSQRLQIDDGASAAVRQNPDVNALHPGSAGTSYNTILRGAPSTSGASGGTSGIGSPSTSGGVGSGSSAGGGASGASGGSSGGGK